MTVQVYLLFMSIPTLNKMYLNFSFFSGDLELTHGEYIVSLETEHELNNERRQCSMKDIHLTPWLLGQLIRPPTFKWRI